MSVSRSKVATLIANAVGHELPENWAQAPLGNIVLLQPGYAFKSAWFVDDGIRLLRGTNIIPGGIRWDDVARIPKSRISEFTDFVLEPGDIVIAMDRPVISSGLKIAVLSKEDMPSLLLQRVGRFKPTDVISPEYLYAFLNGQSFLEHTGMVATGTQLPHISKTDIESAPVPLPPLKEQARIVSAIESLQERSSRTRALLEEVKPLISQLRQSVLRSAFSGRLTADWRAKQKTNDLKGKEEGQGTSTKANSEATRKPDAPTASITAKAGSPQSTKTKFETATELLQRIRTERRKNWETAQLAAFKAKGKKPTKGWQDKYKAPATLDIDTIQELPALPSTWTWATLEELKGLDDNAMTDGPFGSKLKTAFYTGEGVRVVRLGNIGVGEFKFKDEAFISNDRYQDLRKHEIFCGDIVIAALAEPVGRACLIPDTIGTAVVKADCIRFKPHNSITCELVMHWLNSATGQKFAEEASHGLGRLRINMANLRSLPVALIPQIEQPLLVQKIGAAMQNIANLESSLDILEQSVVQLDQSILSKAFRGELVPQDPNDEPAFELLARIRATREAEAATKTAAKKKSSRKKSSSKSKKTG